MLLLALTWLPGIAPAQDTIRVAVEIHDTATGGVFQSAFASAFRGLGDVAVVSRAEWPRYVLTGVVLCLPEPCPEAASYAVALRFYEPANFTLDATSQVWFVAQRLGVNPPRATVDSIADRIWRSEADHESTHGMWVLRWGRDRVAGAAQRLVSQIDTECFAGLRTAERLLASQRWEQYEQLRTSRDWLC